MTIRETIARAFIAARGHTGRDLSRGPLSDRIRDAAVALLVESYGGPVLEVGVGEGLLAREAIAGGIGGTFVGMDISRENLRRARERIKKPGAFAAICARGELLPFKPGSFSGVVCINTLHNQTSWSAVEAIVAASAALVGRGGCLILDVRNAWDPLISTAYRYSTAFDPSTRRLPVRAYRPGRMRRLLDRQGLRIVRKVGVYYPFWFMPSAFVIEARR